MNPKLPVISGRRLVAALEKFGHVNVRQKGVPDGNEAGNSQ